MIYVFIPYYNEDTPEFKKSLESQTYKDYLAIRRNRKKSGILWTKSANDFWRESFKWGKDDDIVCIMNNDIIFDEHLFKSLTQITKGKIFAMEGVVVDWKNKIFEVGTTFQAESFIGHCFAMTLGDFKKSGGFCKLLPHALADIDYGLKICKKSEFTDISDWVIHPIHSYEKINKWSWRSYQNPILWTIFLLRHPNKYTLINILKAWYDGLFR